MTGRFPVPWRIVELPNGFAVEDATGVQLGVFYGRAPDSAGHTGIMTMDEARQMAIDFAKLPELLEQNGDAEWRVRGEGDVTKPNEFEEFRRRVAHEERRRRILVTVLNVLTALALLAIAALVIKMIFY
jgi:hypothetical protein